MGSDTNLDFERLLTPISEEIPSGVELRGDSQSSGLFFQAKEARESARSIEGRLQQARFAGEDETGEDLGRPDWSSVRDLTVDILADKSKDLWVAAWLTEALCRLHGFAGLRDGFRLTRELAERFWDDIHPRPDEDGYGWTVAQLAGLNGEDGDGALIIPIDSIPLTPDTSAAPPLTSLDYKDAVDLEQSSDPERRSQRIEQGAYTLEAFDKAVNGTSNEFFAELLDNVQSAIAEFDQCTQVLDEKCGQDESGYGQGPPSSSIARALSDCLDRVKSLTKHLFDIDEEEAEADSIATVGGGKLVAGGTQTVVSSAVSNREDAFRALLKVSDFFRRTEPHSPVSYALEQAVRWGRMSLPELMKDLISDESTRDDMFRRAGIPVGSDLEDSE